mmetsp:Transcript_49137/g.97644  ORF Transcript_49137/g.97644 Transcript_49137/m.97644 type:complete len:257 (-) Transcript_49137:100-870(-)|eukprot:CAMPEP_0172718550 /NCGR_PEP_ID=MMETSP1074-20121228/74674_1 /TAXON_ID=2916 /ORGANISM="Ceratium fusus, Strain PA161109" /LENGTH=256 /DNA_ID=CAMNT_0013543771 /DNA_START=31 /DNA_END=801 /DNA_ORIENTATION=+
MPSNPVPRAMGRGPPNDALAATRVAPRLKSEVCSEPLPAYAGLITDSFSPWPGDPCAKRPRLDEYICTWSSHCLKQLRDWEQEQDMKKRRLDAPLPTPNSGPRPLEPLLSDDADCTLQGSTFSWGDLSKLADPRISQAECAGAPKSPATLGPAKSSSTGSLNVPTATICTALVPYLQPRLPWTRRVKNGPLPLTLSPVMPLQVAEVVARGSEEFTRAIPEVAAQHKGKPGAHAEVLQREKNLAIVLYRGPGCNIEP